MATTSNPHGLEIPRRLDLHYDYVNQCWTQNGLVLPCGHRHYVGACYACRHRWERHSCGEGCH